MLGQISVIPDIFCYILHDVISGTPTKLFYDVLVI